jgi:TRAP transporter TAXI family solute receptor
MRRAAGSNRLFKGKGGFTMKTRLAAIACLLTMWIGISGASAQQPTPSQTDRMNAGTVGVVSGGIAGTYVRVAADLAAVLDDGDNLRVLAMIGKGSVQNIADVLYLRGVDIGIVQSDVLAYIRRESLFPGVERRINYITKLYNEEFHILARNDIAQLSDLAGKKVNFDNRGSGTFITSTVVFDSLDIKVEPTFYDQTLALERLKAGEIAAMVYVAGKPATLFRDIAGAENLHLLPVPASPKLLETYLPSRLSATDYPRLIQPGQDVETIAVGAVMAVFNWETNNPRYQKVSRFIDAFFGKFEEFQKPPRHPKWQEVSLTAQVPGWKRFAHAEEWLRRATAAGGDPRLRRDFDQFLSESRGGAAGAMTREQREAMFQEFLRWQNQRQR